MVVSPTTTPVAWSMKKLRPIVAPGWMSVPLFEWAHSLMMRGMSGTPITWSSCATRWTVIARRPGYERITSSRLDAAGSPS